MSVDTHLLLPTTGSIDVCPKCKAPASGFRSRYCVRRHEIKDGAFLDLFKVASAPEHIDRECGNCGYFWLEQCADALPLGVGDVDGAEQSVGRISKDVPGGHQWIRIGDGLIVKNTELERLVKESLAHHVPQAMASATSVSGAALERPLLGLDVVGEEEKPPLGRL